MPEKVVTAIGALAEQLIGAEYTPIAYLRSQIVKSIDYIFAVEVTPVVPDAKTKVAVVTVNGLTNQISFKDILG